MSIISVVLFDVIRIVCVVICCKPDSLVDLCCLYKCVQLSKKIERMRAERLSKEMLEDKFSSDDLRDDEKIINNIASPVVHDENAQNPWDMYAFK